jgi:hypothetical protein
MTISTLSGTIAGLELRLGFLRDMLCFCFVGVETLVRLRYQPCAGLSALYVVLYGSIFAIRMVYIEMPAVTVKLTRFFLVDYGDDKASNQTYENCHSN